MYNNFPADVAYNDFFPDIIIGSKAANNARPPSDDNIVSQLQNMLMEKSNYNTICENGVMIEPQLKVVNLIDFSHTNEFIDSGYVAAKRMIHRFASLLQTRFLRNIGIQCATPLTVKSRHMMKKLHHKRDY